MAGHARWRWVTGRTSSLVAPDVRLGVRMMPADEARRMLRLIAALYAMSGISVVQSYATGRATTASPLAFLAGGVAAVGCGGVALLFASVDDDDTVERAFPGLVLALLFGASAAIPTVLYFVGIRERGQAGVVVYVLPLILGFYLLQRRVAALLVVCIAVGHAVLLIASEPIVAPVSQYLFLIIILTCTGVLIGGLVDELDRSARREQRARDALSRMNDDLADRVRRQAEELTAATAARLADVRASRARLVEVADATRRQVERDLHDGAQQRLVTVALRLRNLQGELGSLLAAAGPEGSEVAEELDDICTELGTGLRELRELARGMYPSALGSGLVPAVRDLVTRTGTQVGADFSLDRRLPPVVELTAYFVIAEGLANVVKHAGEPAHVVLQDGDDVLVVEIRDAGPGGADAAGSGLSGLRDRVEAIGGTLAIRSDPGCGTVLAARLPTDEPVEPSGPEGTSGDGASAGHPPCQPFGK